jgi:hypothetical protein
VDLLLLWVPTRVIFLWAFFFFSAPIGLLGPDC